MAEVALAGNAATRKSLLEDVQRAQQGDSQAVEALLQQFRPLLRSRMYQVWAALQDHLPPVEWDEVEAHLRFCFLLRLHNFQPSEGVYFLYYIERMLDFDCRAWVRQHRATANIPFSQLPGETDGIDLDEWMADTQTNSTDFTADLEQLVSVREALTILTDAQRQTIWECCVRGRTENEVAVQLGIARSTVRNRLAGALARLREHLQETVTVNSDSVIMVERLENITRTGRDTSQAASQRTVASRRIFMANDEKRPDLVGIGAGRPVLLQGIFDFEATGLKTPRLLSQKLTYTVPAGYVVGIRFFRVGVICDQMVCLSSVVNGLPHRLVPVAPNATVHVPLAIVDPIVAGSQIEIHIAAAAPGTAIVDIGCLQMPA